MSIEEDPIALTEQDVRWDRIMSITRRHEPFPDEAFHPRAIDARLRIWPRLPFTRSVHLRPVAFEPNIVAFDMMGVVSMMGGMTPYLYLDPDGNLVRRLTSWSQKGSRRWLYVTDAFSVSDEDIDRLEIGIQGKQALLDAEREKAELAVMSSFDEFI